MNNFNSLILDVNQNKMNRNIRNFEQDNTTTNLKLPNILEHTITKRLQDKQSNDKTTMDSFVLINKNRFWDNFISSEEFLKYLDTCFKPEINLEEDNESQQILFSKEKHGKKSYVLDVYLACYLYSKFIKGRLNLIYLLHNIIVIILCE